MIHAMLKNYRQSPRKVRLVADSIRGKKVGVALTHLDFVPKRASLPIKKVLMSAIANAKHNFDVKEEDLFIKTITVDEGYTLKRWRPRARGAAFPINKRTSHIKIVLDDGTGEAKKKAVKKSAKKAVKVSEKDGEGDIDTLGLPKTSKPKAPKVEQKGGAAREKSAAHKVQANRTTNK